MKTVLGLLLGFPQNKSSVADCSCSKWSKSIVSQALRSRIDLFSATNAYYNQTAVRNTYGSTFRIQDLRSRLHTAVVRIHRRSLGILAKAARSNSLWVRVHGPTPHSARIKITRECIWGATGLAKSKIALFLFKILWYDKHPHTHYTVLHWTIQI